MKMKEFQSRLHFRKGDMKVQRYCSKISLHGLQYMTDPDVGIWQKIFWAIAFLIFLSLLIILTQNLQREFLERNTKVELEDSNAPLDEVKFPGVVICSGNQLRKSFIFWIIENLKKLGYDNKVKQSLYSMILKTFYGSQKNLTVYERKIFNVLLNSEFFSNYLQTFVKSLNVSAISMFPEATLLLHQNLLTSDFSINDRKMIEAFFTKMSAQWKLEQRFVSIKWFGNIYKSEKSKIKFDPVKYTSKGICSWLGPLPKDDDEYLFTWPSGVVSGDFL